MVLPDRIELSTSPLPMEGAVLPFQKVSYLPTALPIAAPLITPMNARLLAGNFLPRSSG